MPRPIQLCARIDKEKGQLRLVFRVVGYGTDEFSHMKAGEEITVLVHLGNGFPLEEKEAVLIGGGIGIPAYAAAGERAAWQDTVVVGYRDADHISYERTGGGSRSGGSSYGGRKSGN